MNKIGLFLKKDNFLYTKISVWLLLMYFPLFLNLGGTYMLRWDESRYASSSYEMLHGSNPFVVTYFNQPSLDSAKPPLLHWLQALSIGVFGFNEMSARLPSALAGLILCIAIMYFSIKKFKSFSLGAISTLLLLTTPAGFCGWDHCARTADYDSLLTLFSFVAILYFFQYNEQTHKHKYLFLSFVFFTLAVLTKAAAGLFFVPGMFIYVLIKGNFKQLLKDKWLYISLAFFIVVVGFVLLIREYFNPGYLQALNEMEFLGRHTTAKDGHEGDVWVYFTFLKERFSYFFLFIPFSWVLCLSCKDEKIRNFSLFSLISVLSFYIVLSSAQSKLEWYCLPLFPLLAMQAGILIWILLKYITTFLTSKIPFNKTTLFYLSTTLLLFGPYTQSVSDASQRTVPDWFLNFNNVQEYLKEERDVMRGAILVATFQDTQGPYLFYYYKLNEEGFHLKYQLGYNANYKPGDKLIVEDPEIWHPIEQNYNTTLLDEFRHLRVYKIINKKVTGVNVPAKINFTSKRTVNMMAANGKYLSVSEKKDSQVLANKKTTETKDMFTILGFENDQCAFSPSPNKYMAAEFDKQGLLTANRLNIGPWETFTKIKLENNYLAFKALNGKYLSLDERTGKLFAKADAVGKNEKFKLIER